jgi:hypothetical protein
MLIISSSINRNDYPLLLSRPDFDELSRAALGGIVGLIPDIGGFVKFFSPDFFKIFSK